VSESTDVQRSQTLDERLGAVVVGVDGSEGATEALRWAFAEAHLRNAPLRVVHAWSFGNVGVVAGGYGYFGLAGPPVGENEAELRSAAQAMVDDIVDKVAVGFPDVSVDCQVVDGGAAETLIAAVDAGDLLVVGSRGHGGFAELLLGSVSMQCVHHAPCPVVVVHPPAATSDHGESAGSGAARAQPQPVLTAIL
jgi:nucleotide-binding universal stress UspA family protein